MAIEEKGKIHLVGSQVMVTDPDARSYLFPSALSESTLLAWLSIEDQNDPAFPGRVIARVPVAERRRIVDAAKMYGGVCNQLLHHHARLWAHLSHADGVWDVASFTFVYRSYIHTPLVTEVCITNRDLRLVRERSGVVRSLAEFALHHDYMVGDYLQEFVDKTRQEVRIANDVLSAPLRSAKLSVVDAQSRAYSIQAVGPSVLPASEWLLEPGLVFLAEEPEESSYA